MDDNNSEKSIKPLIRWYFLKGFIFCLILLFSFLFLDDACLIEIDGSARRSQNLTMLLLHQYIDSVGYVPASFVDLRNQYSFLENVKYYPDAWGEPGRILLCSKWLISGTYVVTFGDGTQASLTRWIYKRHKKSELKDEENVKPKIIHPAQSLSYIGLLCFCLLIVIFFVIPSKKRIISSIDQSS